MSPSNCSLAVGSQSGSLLILSPTSFLALYTIPTKLPISLLKYSPDGLHLIAVLFPPSNSINVYDVQNGYVLRGSLQGSENRVIAVDFSESGKGKGLCRISAVGG